MSSAWNYRPTPKFLYCAMLLIFGVHAYSAPLTDSEAKAIQLFSGDSTSVADKLDAILTYSDAIADVLCESDASWLTAAISDAVSMAPFTETRKKCVESVTKIADTVLAREAHATPPLALISMPLNCLLMNHEIDVAPSYHEQEIIGFLTKYRRHPDSEVRLIVLKTIFRVGMRDAQYKKSALLFLEEQELIERGFRESEGLDGNLLGKNGGVIDTYLSLLRGEVNLKFAQVALSDVAFQALLKASRAEQLEMVVNGDFFAWRLFKTTPISQSEEEVLLASIGKENPSEHELEILQKLTYGIQKEKPREEEDARIDRLLEWFRIEMTRTESNSSPSVRKCYINMLSRLALEGREGRAVRGQQRRSRGVSAHSTPQLHKAAVHLDLERGKEVIHLVEFCLDDPDKSVRIETERVLAQLRPIYQESRAE